MDEEVHAVAGGAAAARRAEVGTHADQGEPPLRFLFDHLREHPDLGRGPIVDHRPIEPGDERVGRADTGRVGREDLPQIEVDHHGTELFMRHEHLVVLGTVLDFISDVRRAAAMSNMRRQVTGEPEAIVLPSSHSITFTDAKAERLIEAWLQDVADLESAADESVPDFPDFLEPY